MKWLMIVPKPSQIINSKGFCALHDPGQGRMGAKTLLAIDIEMRAAHSLLVLGCVFRYCPHLTFLRFRRTILATSRTSNEYLQYFQHHICTHVNTPICLSACSQLQDNQLSGMLPSSWSSLESLRLLNLSHNILHGPLPASYGLMTSLTHA